MCSRAKKMARHDDVMAQHFLLSKAAKTLTLAQVFRMTDAEAETMFCRVRWADTDGAPVCPACGVVAIIPRSRPLGRAMASRVGFFLLSGSILKRPHLAALRRRPSPCRGG
jgi:hypothetical protein